MCHLFLRQIVLLLLLSPRRAAVEEVEVEDESLAVVVEGQDELSPTVH